MPVLPRGSFIRKEKEVGDVAMQPIAQDSGRGLTMELVLEASKRVHLLLKGSLGTTASRGTQHLLVKCAGLVCGVVWPQCLSLRLKG